jgi:DnaJ family protein C protein 2
MICRSILTHDFAATIKRRLIPAGAAYLEHVRLVTKNLTFEDHDAHLLAEEARLAAVSGAAGAEEDDFGVGDEPESPELAKLDPKEWKKQDHYEVLGLSKFRYKATNDQIKVARTFCYLPSTITTVLIISADKKKVLKHHPDKKSSTSHGTSTNDDAFFKCIQKAMDVLTNPERRRQFDSVDPHYMELEEDAPTAKTFAGLKGAELERAFFRKFGPVFEREARFSTKQPVPLLGAPDAGKEEVEGFYNFWYNFDSWRGFEYLDKEVNEGSDSCVPCSVYTFTLLSLTLGSQPRRQAVH